MSIAKTAKRVAKRILPRHAQELLRPLARRLPARQHRFGFPTAAPSSPPSPYAFPIDRDNPLETLGAKYQPTKRLHNYLVYYWMHFRDIRDRVRNVLEIGVQTDRSIRMWEEFFPNATIYGLDIDPKCARFEGGRRRIVIGDQSDYDVLAAVTRGIDGPLDIVIDDASHLVEHQLRSFNYLFPTMSRHGIYVIEDTGGCVGDYGLKTVNALKTVVDSILYWPPELKARDWPRLGEFDARASWLDRNVIGIAFYRWIAFVMRGRNPQDNPHLPLADDVYPPRESAGD